MQQESFLSQSSNVLFGELLRLIDSHPQITQISAAMLRAHVQRLREITAGENLMYMGPPSARQGAQQTGYRVYYDELIDECFQQVSQAVSREELLRHFMDSLHGLGRQSPARCIFVLEEMPDADGGTPLEITGLEQRRIVPERWRNFCGSWLPRFAKSEFFTGTIRERNPLELWYSPYIPGYDGEFDALFYQSREPRKRGYWISAMPLPSGSARGPNRTLFVLYPNRGDEIRPKLPGGAVQEWRALSFLGMAYQMLNHQLASIAEQVHARRQELLTTLAPGILHHEIGIQISVIRSLVSDQNHLVQRLREYCPEEGAENMGLLMGSVGHLYDAARRLYGVTDAFNNLERRQASERFRLESVVAEAYTVIYNRLGNAGVGVEWDDEELALEITSDPALLLHLLVNIFLNAIHAFIEHVSEETDAQERTISIRVGEIPTTEPDALPIILEIYNNGPPISAENLERIFEKGFTTRRDGHGQGLYICRLISQYLGGQLRAIDPQELAAEYTVGFRLELPLTMPHITDLESERTPKNKGKR
ncbi:MAG: Histidine kinase-, DNA gyrase B-, and HSP90-like ATPase [Candidatus Kentron sp. G]|nr:MAG: Histidine kinase-, DNA gyrase B-, and HSP90-like ATPase [Candidatus Kentron sp. G]VFM95664.1 MAG: Histidine kinase-, DNA gyrase B-, and HSP90-like ATPase [Candidatus Kentron sp. G]VFM97389.1 MAG: Histidine kinase-, DNA gyrase B-, and HSP90-like ATPase [Candidatus Kentron sp. G]